MRMGVPAFFPRHIRYLLFLCLFLPLAVYALPPQGNDEATPAVQNLYAEAKAARQRGDSASAIDKYNQILKLAPHLAAAYNNLGMLYFDGHDYERAVKVLQRGLELNPNMPGATAMLGMSYFQIGKNDKAQPLLEAALRANPKDDQVEMVLIHVLINGQKLQ